MNRTLVYICFILILAVACCGCSSQEKRADSITASAAGHNGDILVNVGFDGNEIASVEILSQSETLGMTEFTLKRIPEIIVSRQTLDVDVIAGCTVTSNAIISAVSKAVEQRGLTLVPRETNDNSGGEALLYEADVVVIGGGAAGLSSAMTAMELGKSVLLIEKMSVLGGNTLVCGGTFNVVNPELQSIKGISDSVDLFIKNTYEGGLMKGDIKLVSIMCENAYDAYRWLIEHGTKFKEKAYLTIGGMWPRSVDMDGDCYTQLIKPFTERLENGGATILTQVRATELTLSQGRICGVLARGTADGREYRIKAKNGVVLATGGFSKNREMLLTYAPDAANAADANGWVTSTGDGIIMARNVGAELTDMSYVQLLPGTPEGQYAFNNEIENTIFVNQLGKRFANEQSRRDELAKALMNQPGQTMYILFDSQTIDESFTSARDRVTNYLDYHELAKQGKCYYGETLEDLARDIGVDQAELSKTVNEYNRIVDGIVPDPFGRELFFKKIGLAPYYATKKVPKIHYTMGGVRIDENARVQSVQGRAIPGLYAAGEVTGGIHGANRLGGNSLVDCVVFGRIAGSGAANPGD